MRSWGYRWAGEQNFQGNKNVTDNITTMQSLKPPGYSITGPLTIVSVLSVTESAHLQTNKLRKHSNAGVITSYISCVLIR